MQSILDNPKQSLTIEPISINISKALDFGYEIGVYEGDYHFSLSINQ